MILNKAAGMRGCNDFEKARKFCPLSTPLKRDNPSGGMYNNIISLHK